MLSLVVVAVPVVVELFFPLVFFPVPTAAPTIVPTPGAIAVPTTAPAKCPLRFVFLYFSL